MNKTQIKAKVSSLLLELLQEEKQKMISKWTDKEGKALQSAYKAINALEKKQKSLQNRASRADVYKRRLEESAKNLQIYRDKYNTTTDLVASSLKSLETIKDCSDGVAMGTLVSMAREDLKKALDKLVDFS